MSNQIVSKSAEASNIKQFDIAGNSGGESVSIAGGIIKFEYFESILIKLNTSLSCAGVLTIQPRTISPVLYLLKSMN